MSSDAPDEPLTPIDPDAPYLRPYARAARRTKGNFAPLLWASPATQAARFDALTRIVDLHGARVLDVGCGRADLLEHLAKRHVKVAQYVGVEAVPALLAVARERAAARPGAAIVEADFVADPQAVFAGAEVIVFSGSLNTLDPGSFYDVIGKAARAAGRCVAFNFLCSPSIAAADYLYWHRVDEVMRFAYTISPVVH